MIGKMYRPLKILGLEDNRGFGMDLKFKSNFGGSFNFKVEIFLNYVKAEQTEKILIKISGLPVKAALNDLENYIINKEKTSLIVKRELIIDSLRKMYRPSKMSSKEDLNIEFPIISQRNEAEDDCLILNLQPVIKDNEEYMLIKFIAKSSVEITSESGVAII